jgi:hypothetical protein
MNIKINFQLDYYNCINIRTSTLLERYFVTMNRRSNTINVPSPQPRTGWSTIFCSDMWIRFQGFCSPIISLEIFWRFARNGQTFSVVRPPTPSRSQAKIRENIAVRFFEYGKELSFFVSLFIIVEYLQWTPLFSPSRSGEYLMNSSELPCFPFYGRKFLVTSQFNEGRRSNISSLFPIVMVFGSKINNAKIVSHSLEQYSMIYIHMETASEVVGKHSPFHGRATLSLTISCWSLYIDT